MVVKSIVEDKNVYKLFLLFKIKAFSDGFPFFLFLETLNGQRENNGNFRFCM